MLLAMPIVAPGALGSIRNQLFTSQVAQSNSTTGRTQDYAAVQPDLAAHPTFGRGYGSYDPHKYRIIDNQYIGLAIETGFVGVGAYLLMLLGVVVAARPALRSGDPRAARPPWPPRAPRSPSASRRRCSTSSPIPRCRTCSCSWRPRGGVLGAPAPDGVAR